MKPCQRIIILGALCLIVWPKVAAAQLHFAGDEPRIYTIEPRTHLFKHEIQLGVGVLPLNAFYVGAVAAGSYTYHINELWGWEVLNGFYSQDFDTGLTNLLQGFGAQADKAAQKRLRFHLASSVRWKPMYGKIAVFNKGVVQADTSLTAGVGAMVSNQDTAAALNLGASLHFWASEGVAVRFDVRDYLVFSTFAPDNVLMLLLSVSFNFSVRTIEAQPTSG